MDHRLHLKVFILTAYPCFIQLLLDLMSNKGQAVLLFWVTTNQRLVIFSLWCYRFSWECCQLSGTSLPKGHKKICSRRMYPLLSCTW